MGKYLKLKYLLWLLIILLVGYLKLLWLFEVCVIFITLYGLGIYLIAYIKPSWFQKFIKGIFLFLFLISTLISLRLLVFDIYKIPSSSMESTLFPNDIILVNKLDYGPRLPRSPFDIPWINIAFYFNKKARDSMKVNWWPHKRLSGASIVKNNDVFVYENYSKNVFYVKRAVGISGDTLEIKKGHVFINSVFKEVVETIRNRYRLKVTDRRTLYRKLDSLEVEGYIESTPNRTDCVYGDLTNAEFKKIKQLRCVDSINLDVAMHNKKEQLFVEPEGECWTVDDLGPIIIPKRGMKIILNDKNYALYKTILNLYEGVRIEKLGTTFYINEKVALSYIFKQDYFFMMGDNRRSSFDSRFFGFLPSDKIVGRVKCVLLSNYQDEFRWDRILKTIN